MKRRIKLILPVATTIWNEPALNELNKYKDESTIIDVVNIKKGSESIENSFDEVWCALPTVQEVMKAEKEQYDGVIIYCFGDPGLQAAKEVAKIPVIGIGEASAYIASLIGKRFGIITAGEPEAGSYLENNLKVYELYHKCVGIRSVGIPVLSLIGSEEEELKVLLKFGTEMLNKGADVLVLGCGSMLGIADKASEKLGVPIVIPAAAATKLCESLIAMGLAQSKKAYQFPPSKKRSS
ncbi:MAG: aspartate/glutamate racemase family protein [Atribacterota bacterium]|jgi:allantoin racemase|nr:aspartate/glutamate racemase family protein [Atribacterota bacterium]MDD4895327.1 aspartate/glutamate racemase family protein [Atribacterota bacterium]MDD5637496.1 aspartate/glutamate racemase family protein [Atribacterota bacterium]